MSKALFVKQFSNKRKVNKMKNKTLIIWAILITALTIGAFLVSFSSLHGGMMIGMERYKTAALAIGPVIGLIVVISGVAVAFVGIAGATAGLSAIVALGIMAVAFTAFAGLMTGFAIMIVFVIGGVGCYIVYSTIANNENKDSIMCLNIMEMIAIAGSLAVITFS